MKKSRKNSKGGTWEWEETPEMTEALKRLHNDLRKLESEADDYGIGK